MKITSIDPFSIKEGRPKIKTPEKPAVEAAHGAELDGVSGRTEGKIVDIIEEAQRRAKKRHAQAERRKRKALITYTKVGLSHRPLHEKGKKLDTRG